MKMKTLISIILIITAITAIYVSCFYLGRTGYNEIQQTRNSISQTSRDLDNLDKKLKIIEEYIKQQKNRK